MKKSFTLIELLVVITIMIIFIGSILAQYNTYTEQTKLKNDGRKLVDVLELAKKKALSADLIVTPFVTPPTYCTNFTGYRVTISSSSYSLLFGCALVYSTVQNYNLPTNLTVTVGTGDYNFPPLMSGLNITINSVQLKNSAINKCVNISISSIGIAELDETLVGC